MASYRALAATGQAILNLLAEACPKPEFAGARFELFQASHFQSPIDEGISLYLFRVVMNGTVRNMPPRTGPDGRKYRPPLPLDLYFLLTAWAKDPVKQQHLLGWAVRTLEDTPILPSGLLNNQASGGEVFRGAETVEVTLDAISISDMASLWEVAKTNQQPSVVYVARMVGIDSDVSLVEPGVVQTRVFDMGERVAR